ncbi:hypothetical protein I2494_00710 [Budviciaceae bacterium BWR-B9]|uniref:Uncharacterized protein n=1 Tax=Limnobaculum allomyrinae TaxID=2791986 RepID=A0ABS1IKH9_9GAMM|nr:MULTISPECIES: hypothetical protein [Limnobaculum]MBK5142253.1 hypothetical protein [Limnobaculum allomyrinae]MBV7690863.1 hypothetical protein [Limnobaculum sp. M2-1]
MVGVIQDILQAIVEWSSNFMIIFSLCAFILLYIFCAIGLFAILKDGSESDNCDDHFNR